MIDNISVGCISVYAQVTSILHGLFIWWTRCNYSRSFTNFCVCCNISYVQATYKRTMREEGSMLCMRKVIFIPIANMFSAKWVKKLAWILLERILIHSNLCIQTAITILTDKKHSERSPRVLYTQTRRLPSLQDVWMKVATHETSLVSQIHTYTLHHLCLGIIMN